MPNFLNSVSNRPRLTIVGVGLLLLLAGSWLLPLLDRDEPRFAEAAREMSRRGDAVIPWFNDGYRFDKPPLIYWCQIASYQIWGETELGARFPGMVFTIATALVLQAWGRRLGRPVAGLAAGLMFLTCVQVQIHGRLAVADMPMVFFFTLAVWGGWEWAQAESRSRTGWWWLTAGALGLGFLAKGPEAWLPLIGLALWARPSAAERPWRGPYLLAAGLVALAITAAWGVPALIRTHGEFLSVGLGQHVVGRSVGVIDGHGVGGWLGYVGSLPLYGLTFFVSFLPWAFAVPGELRAWWPGRSKDVLGTYLLGQAAVVFVVFTLMRTKLIHYTLPAFPFIALWLALRRESIPDFGRWFTHRLTAMAVLVLGLMLLVAPLLRPWFVASELWARLCPVVQPETRLVSVSYGEASLVWKFRSVMTNHVILNADTNTVAAALRAPGPWILLAPTNYVPPVAELLAGASAIPVAGGDVSRWVWESQTWRVGGWTIPGGIIRPRVWRLTAWLSPGTVIPPESMKVP